MFHFSFFHILFFDIRNEAELSNFNIQNPISTFALKPKIVFWHSKTYFDIRFEAEYRILTFEILSWYSNWCRISYFVIWSPISTFKLSNFFLLSKSIFWHSNWSRISYFDIWNPILKLNRGRISYFDIQNPILTFELRMNIVLWHSTSFSDIRREAKYRILTIEILFLRWN